MQDFFMLSSDPFLLIHWLGLGLVLIGLTLFFTAYYFRRQSKRLSNALSDLYRLNQTVKQDALDFFDQSWPILESLGCLQITAHIGWFGEQKKVCLGAPSLVMGKRQLFNIERDEMRFDLILILNRKAAEPDSLSFLVIKTFVSILEQNLVLKQSEILTSQKRLERYQLFVQHEIKNIAQFIQLLCEQVNRLQQKNTNPAVLDEHKLRLIERLHQTLPIMAQRAQKTILHMKQPLLKHRSSTDIKLHVLLQEVVKMYDLDAKIKGDAIIYLPLPLLEEVFKNILGNFRDHALTEQPLDISVNQSAQTVVIKIECLQNKPYNKMLAERLFEPFWTTSESGMGLGLFLARELLKQMNGQVTFEQSKKRFGFLVQLPSKTGERDE